MERRIVRLFHQGRNDFGVSGEGASIRRRHVGLHRFVQLRQSMKWNHREHVVFDVIVHVPVKKAEHRIHHHRAAVPAMVEHILGHARVLRETEVQIEPRAVQARQADEEHGRIVRKYTLAPITTT